MLGTGIASADEDVNPDKPASPLDGSLTIPFNLQNNTLGTPLGQRPLPESDREFRVSVADVTRAVPATGSVTAPVTSKVTKARETAAPVVTKARNTVGQVADQARDQSAPLAVTAQPAADKINDVTEAVTEKLEGLPLAAELPETSVEKLDSVPDVTRVDPLGADPVSGNHVNGNVVVPVDMSGNAVAVFGEAEVMNESYQWAGHWRGVYTDGSHAALAGNVVDLDYASPVQVTGNAVAVGGKAFAASSSGQEATETGDIVTDGSNGVLSGNAAATQLSAPVQVSGNAAAGLGRAVAISEAETTATSGGSVLSSGQDSAAGGNVAGVPAAVPVKANGNGVAVVGAADAWSESLADATAGKTRQGLHGVPTYLETNGDPALLAGNVAQPAASGPVMLCGNAATANGAVDANCATATDAVAGGTNRTTGAESILSGGVAHAPVALPVQGFGNSVAGAGDAEADAENSVDSIAGGAVYTRGHESVLSGSNAVTPITGTADLFANSVAGLGEASSTGAQELVAGGGGYTGTTGDDSIIGGNQGVVPVTLPVEGFGNAVGVAGGSEATGSETKGSSASGGGNTADDYGIGASNLMSTPVASAVQAFGNGAGVLADTDATGTTEYVVNSGGDVQATGKKGLLSGNIGQVPAAVPVQVFGSGAGVLAKGTQTAVHEGVLSAGGDATSDGTDGGGAGNVLTTPVAGAVQFYGQSLATFARNDSLVGSVTETEAGGDTETSGADGVVAGNVVSPQALPVVQSFAAVASALAGDNASVATNVTDAESGGDIDTSGADGVVAGNLVDVPAAGVVQPFGDAVAALGSRSYAAGLNDTVGEVGGESTTDGEFGKLSGFDGTLPAGVDVPVYDVPLEVVARAVTESSNVRKIVAGEREPNINLPLTGGMSPTDMPTLLPRQQERTMSADSFRGAFSGVLSDFAHSLPANVPVETPGEFHILPAPHPMDRVEITDPVGDVLGGGLGGNLLGGLLGGGAGGLVPTGGLPIDELGGLPVSDLSGATGGLPVNGLGGLAGALPAGDLGGATGGLPVNGLGGATGALPVNGLGGLAGALPAGDLGGATGSLPVHGLDDVNGGLPVSDLAGLTGGLPVNGRSGATGGLPVNGLGSLTGSLPVDDLGGLAGTLPVNGLGRTRDLPLDGLRGLVGLPVDGLVTRDGNLPVDGLTGALPVSGLGGVADRLPVRDVTVSRGLPALGLDDVLGGLPTHELDNLGGNMQVTQLGRIPVGDQRDIGENTQLGINSFQLSDVLAPLEGGVLNGLGGGRSDDTVVIPAITDLTDGDLNEVTAVLPVIPATDDLTDVTTVIPVIPAVPAVPAPALPSLPVGPVGPLPTDVTNIPGVPDVRAIPGVPSNLTNIPGVPSVGDVVDAPLAHLPSLNALPVRAPGLSGVHVPVVGLQAPIIHEIKSPSPDSVQLPALDDSSLDATRAALANLFARNPIA